MSILWPCGRRRAPTMLEKPSWDILAFSVHWQLRERGALVPGGQCESSNGRCLSLLPCLLLMRVTALQLVLSLLHAWWASKNSLLYQKPFFLLTENDEKSKPNQTIHIVWANWKRNISANRSSSEGSTTKWDNVQMFIKKILKAFIYVDIRWQKHSEIQIKWNRK
jgi:hypothetical protein